MSSRGIFIVSLLLDSINYVKEFNYICGFYKIINYSLVNSAKHENKSMNGYEFAKSISFQPFVYFPIRFSLVFSESFCIGCVVLLYILLLLMVSTCHIQNRHFLFVLRCKLKFTLTIINSIFHWWFDHTNGIDDWFAVVNHSSLFFSFHCGLDIGFPGK